jgi:GTP pyrophosphokinase
MTGARVNGKMVAIDTILKNGDIVEILVKENARPSHRMLDSAKTSLAKKHIRNAMGKQL